MEIYIELEIAKTSAKKSLSYLNEFCAVHNFKCKTKITVVKLLVVNSLDLKNLFLKGKKFSSLLHIYVPFSVVGTELNNP